MNKTTAEALLVSSNAEVGRWSRIAAERPLTADEQRMQANAVHQMGRDAELVAEMVEQEASQARLAALAARDSILGAEFRKPIIGVPVSLAAAGDTSRRFVGTVVALGEDARSVWVRGLEHDDETTVWYSISSLDFATQKELAEVARYFLRIRTDESLKVQAEARKAQEAR